MKLRLKELREGAGLTQGEMAQALGLSAPFVSQMENGKREPSAATLQAIADWFGLSVAEIIDAKDEAGDLARLVAAHGRLSQEDREALLRMAEALAARQP